MYLHKQIIYLLIFMILLVVIRYGKNMVKVQTYKKTRI